MLMRRKKRSLLLMLLFCTVLAGCGREETGSELLTETKEAIVPVEETVAPVTEQTPEGMLLRVYCGDEQAEHIVCRTVSVEEVTEQVIMQTLIQELNLDEKAGLKEISFGVYGGDKVVLLDLNQAFGDYLKKLSQQGETIVMGSLTNTFLDAYQSELLLVTVEGKVLDTGRDVYEEYLERYPYIDAAYQIEEIVMEEEGIHIVYPQIKNLGQEWIQEKWNRLMKENEARAVESWMEDGNQGTYEVSCQVKTMTADTLSILMVGRICEEEAAHPYSFKYTYNIDLNTGESIQLKDHVDVETLAENLFAGTGYYVEEGVLSYFLERLEAIYETPDSLAKSLEGYDFSEEGNVPYGYSYLEDGKVWICMEVPHALGDYMEIELDAQQS